jgi:ATP-binding cassette subfamily F protein uup
MPRHHRNGERTVAAAPILSLQDIRFSLGSTLLLEGAALSLLPAERIALVGRNGSGKSTLMRIAAGAVQPDAGRRFLQPGATIRYLPQEPALSGYATTLDYVEAGLAAGDAHFRATHLLEALGLTGAEDPSRLSGGEARRAALARVLAPLPDILLLDEPTNHLDLPAIEWLETELRSMHTAMVIVSHDRRVLGELTGATVWLDRGETRRLERGFAAFEEWRDTLLEEEEHNRHKLDRQIEREEHWLTYGVTARRKRNVRRLQALRDLRRERRERKRAVGDVKLSVSAAELSGRIVVDADGIAKSLGGRVLARNFSTRVLRGDRVGIVGPNGAGKTTLLRLLTGALEPDAGTVRLGANIELAVLDQLRASLDPDLSLREALTGGGSDTLRINGEPRHVMGYLQDFLFTPAQAGTPVGKLSGGERGRLALARALSLPSNLLVLDEPTNDLDFETLDLLEEMVADYTGTVILVSHDRDFLDRVATSVIVAEGDGRWTEYAGGYSDMVAQRGFGVRAAVARAPERTERSKAAPAAAPARKPRLSFKQKHALEKLPGEMAKLEAEIARLDRVLSDPGLYARDAAAFNAAAGAQAAARQALARAEDEWLDLEALREEIEG